MPNPTDSITLDGKNHLVVQRAGYADIRIDTADAGDIHRKLEQLAPPQLALLLQVVAEQQLPALFTTLLRGMASQKNVVQGSIHAQAVRIGDEVHYHFHLEEKTATLPKKLSLDIPTLAPDAVVGRDRELHDLRQLLLTRREALLLNGLGGIGKTTLAQAYIQAHWDDYQHLVWVSQSPGNAFPLDFITTKGLRENLGIPDNLTDPDDIFHELARRLNAIDTGPNLLILDNVEDNIEPYRGRLPGMPHWHVLLTSREEIDGFTPMPLDFLKPEAALALFKKHYTLSGLTDAQINELAAAVDYHTLTLEILAKTARVQRYPFAELRSALALDARANVKINRPGSDKIDRITTFLAGIFSLSRLTPDEVWLLQQFACLPSEYHAYDLLYELIEPQAARREAAFAETLHELGRKGWLLHDAGADTYKMHLVVAEVVKRERPPTFAALSRLWDNMASKLLIDRTRDNPVDKFPWIPFGKALLEVTETESATTFSITTSIRRWWSRLLGSGEKQLVRLQNNLALVLQDYGDYEEAKTLFEKAMRMDEQYFGLSHPITAVSYSNLALAFRDLGNYEEAKTLLEKAVLIDEQNFGLMHPSTINDYSNLALVLQALGDFQGAKTLLEKALHSAEQNFGPEHPSTAVIYSNLATVLQDLGDCQGAKALLENALLIDEKNFGPDHPSTTTSYSNLALVLLDLGDYRRAQNLLEKAVRSDEQNFGPDHPRAAVSYSNLALVLQELGDYKGALELSGKAIAIAEKRLPLEHPHIGMFKDIYESSKQQLK